MVQHLLVESKDLMDLYLTRWQLKPKITAKEIIRIMSQWNLLSSDTQSIVDSPLTKIIKQFSLG